MSYDSEDGKDAWKRYRRMVEAIDPPMQEMLHEFGSEQFAYGFAAGVQATRDAVDAYLEEGTCVDCSHTSRDSDILAAIDALMEGK